MTDRSNEGAAPEARRSRRTTWLVVAVLVVAVGVVAGVVTVSLSSKSSPAATSPPSTTPPSTIPSGSNPAGGTRRQDFTPPRVIGTIASVGSSSFTVRTRTGSATTVKVTGSTQFSGSGITGLSSLKKGTAVAVYGSGTSSSVTATRVTAGFAGAGRGGFSGGGNLPGGRSGAFGTITAIGSDSFTVSSRSGTTKTVDVTSTTTYSSSSGTLSGLSALKTGEDVIVQGSTSDSVVKATSVRVFQPGIGGGFGGGGFGGGGVAS